MGDARPLSVQAGRHLLRWRTRLGRATALWNLDLLAVAVQAKGYRFVKLYQADEFPTRPRCCGSSRSAGTTTSASR